MAATPHAEDESSCSARCHSMRATQEGRTEKGKSVYNAKAYSAASATSPLASATFPRRDSTERDVQLEILFCGICHSDLHQVRNEWRDVMPTVYPCVPGTRSWAVARFNEVERIRFRRDPSERSLLETLIRKGSSPAHRLLNADLVEGGRL
jgi:hypothetical protein